MVWSIYFSSQLIIHLLKLQLHLHANRILDFFSDDDSYPFADLHSLLLFVLDLMLSNYAFYIFCVKYLHMDFVCVYVFLNGRSNEVTRGRRIAKELMLVVAPKGRTKTMGWLLNNVVKGLNICPNFDKILCLLCWYLLICGASNIT